MEMEMKQTLIGIAKSICFVTWAILTVGIYDSRLCVNLKRIQLY